MSQSATAVTRALTRAIYEAVQVVGEPSEFRKRKSGRWRTRGGATESNRGMATRLAHPEEAISFRLDSRSHPEILIIQRHRGDAMGWQTSDKIAVAALAISTAAFAAAAWSAYISMRQYDLAQAQYRATQAAQEPIVSAAIEALDIGTKWKVVLDFSIIEVIFRVDVGRNLPAHLHSELWSTIRDKMDYVNRFPTPLRISIQPHKHGSGGIYIVSDDREQISGGNRAVCYIHYSIPMTEPMSSGAFFFLRFCPTLIEISSVDDQGRAPVRR